MQHKRKKLLSLLLMLSAVVGLLPGLTAPANAESIVYMEASYAEGTGVTYTSKTAEATALTSSSTSLNDGWYYVTGNVTVSSRISVSGTVNLILCDGATLTASKGITVSDGNSLTIYGQTDGTGTLSASGYSESDSNGDAYITSCGAGIGGESIFQSRWDEETEDMVEEELGAPAGGTVTICGGAVTATGGQNSAGIGGANKGQSGAITVNGGTVTANGGFNGAGIGGGYGGGGGTITINGGKVTAAVRLPLTAAKLRRTGRMARVSAAATAAPAPAAA